MAHEEIALRQRGGTPAQEPPQEDRKPPDQGFKKFLWNTETKQFLGRSSSSWGKILLFYLVFYATICGLSLACWCVFYRQLDMKVPYRKLHDSIIKPGLIQLPQGDAGYIHMGRTESFSSELNQFLEPYITSGNQETHGLQSCSHENQPVDRKTTSCFQNAVSSFGSCDRTHDYGFHENSPCIFLKFNKIYGWEPEYYDDPNTLPTSMPEDLKNHIFEVYANNKNATRTVWVSCEGAELKNAEVLYMPERGFPGYFFPFVNAKNYLSPLVAVQFKNLPRGKLVNVKCRAWAKGFPSVREPYISETRFVIHTFEET